MLSIKERAWKYLWRMEPAISGNGGRRCLYKAALALVKGFGLTEDEALALIPEWNSGCLPPWSEKELRSVLRDAAKALVADKYLLGDDSRRPSPPAPRTFEPALNDDAAKASRRAEWKLRRLATEQEMLSISSLRPGVSVKAVHQLATLGFLWRARHRQADCYVIRDGADGTFAQARRFDGEKFNTLHGPAKNVNLPGSQGRWLSPGGLGGAPHVLVAEGAIAALELIEIIRRAEDVSGAALSAAVLVAVSASVGLTGGILQNLAGRKITVLADNDDVGSDAAARWAGQITTATGTRPRCLRPTNGCKDFGEMLAILPADAPAWNELVPNF